VDGSGVSREPVEANGGGDAVTPARSTGDAEAELHADVGGGALVLPGVAGRVVGVGERADVEDEDGNAKSSSRSHVEFAERCELIFVGGAKHSAAVLRGSHQRY
jgi:hypothetical protein